MRHALCTLVALMAAMPLRAEWRTVAVYNGTANTDVPVAVAIRTFGPTHDVILVVERRDGTNGPATKHFLKMLRFDCQDAGCLAVAAYPALDVPPADQPVPDGLTNDQYYNASLALRGSPVLAPLKTPLGPIEVLYKLDSAHIVRRTGPTAPCGSTQLDLGEERWTFNPGAWSHFNISTNTVGNCQDRQLSYTQESDGFLHTCWTQDPTAALNDNQVWCASRNLTSAFTIWSGSLLAAGVDDQDHMAFVVDPVTDRRYVVHRDRDQSPDGVALRVPEVGTAGSLPPVAADQDYPSIARAPDNSYHAVWHSPKNAGGQIHYSTCPATSDCTAAANWSPSVQIRSANGARHAELAIAADGRMMMTWMEAGPSGDRVHFTETCAGSNWPAGGGEVPRPAIGLQVSQSTFLGRPHLSIDDRFDLVHLAFVEFNNKSNPSDGDVHWARKTFTACQP